MSSIRPQSRRRAKIDGEALVWALLAYRRGEPRVCAMVRPPRVADVDWHHLCRERTVLIKGGTHFVIPSGLPIFMNENKLNDHRNTKLSPKLSRGCEAETDIDS